MTANFFNEFGIYPHEINAFRDKSWHDNLGKKAAFGRLNTLRRNQNLSPYIARALWDCQSALSEVGAIGQMYIVNEDLDNLRKNHSYHSQAGDWEILLQRVYCDPIAFKNRINWLLFQALLRAQTVFALDVCPPRSHETYLTGELVGSIRAACADWSGAAQGYLSRNCNTVEITGIDLSVGGYEQRTGGDLAVILDLNETHISPCDLEPETIRLTGPLRGSVVIPLVFQAKRYVGLTADISRRHDERGYQFHTLRQTKCASNYIFYENGEDRIPYPALPMVKAASACQPVELFPSTHVFEDSVDLATYILRALNGFADIPAAESREDALNMILANASTDRLSRITILGDKTEGELDRLYGSALDALRKEIATDPGPQDTLETPRL